MSELLAHLRPEAQKIQRRASVSSPLAEELAERFLRAYVRAAGDHGDERRLRLRTTVYEAIALVRLALRAQEELDETHLEITTAVLEERMSAIAAGSVRRSSGT